MNYENFNINFNKSLVAQTFYATPIVQQIAEAFETNRYTSGLPTGRMIVQQVFQGLLPVTTGFALLALKMH